MSKTALSLTLKIYFPKLTKLHKQIRHLNNLNFKGFLVRSVLFMLVKLLKLKTLGTSCFYRVFVDAGVVCEDQ